MGNFEVNKDYIHNNKRCVIITHTSGHHCGYVGVNNDHPLYGVGYSDKSELLKSKLEWLKEQPQGKRGILSLLTWDRDSVSPELLFDVHGGLTYSGGNDKYPVESNLWWFGYDCAHCDDTPETCDVDYCIAECNSLADQLSELEEEICRPARA